MAVMTASYFRIFERGVVMVQNVCFATAGATLIVTAALYASYFSVMRPIPTEVISVESLIRTGSFQNSLYPRYMSALYRDAARSILTCGVMIGVGAITLVSSVARQIKLETMTAVDSKSSRILSLEVISTIPTISLRSTPGVNSIEGDSDSKVIPENEALSTENGQEGLECKDLTPKHHIQTPHSMFGKGTRQRPQEDDSLGSEPLVSNNDHHATEEGSNPI